MKVKDLIQKLKKMPQDAEVMHLWDGRARTSINVVYKAKNGKVITSDFDQMCYDSSFIPTDANEDEYWSTNEIKN